MKVAIVLNTSWNIYNFRMNLVKALQDAGHEVHTIAPHDEYSELLEKAGCIHHNVWMDSRGANPIKDSALILELFFIYKRIRPDAILHFTIKPNVYGTLAAALLNIPCYNNVCGLGTVFLKKGLVSWIAKALYKIAFLFPEKVFFQNPEDMDLFLKEKLIKGTQTDLVPGSGVDLSRFQPKPYRRNEEFTFLMISRIIKDKGMMEYIDAIRLLRNQGVRARFQLLGAKDPLHKRGIALDVVDSWIEEGLIEYLGHTDDVRPFIEKADCVVLPSYREGVPRTLLEAASSARPIVATDVAGCRQVVTHNFNGLLCRMKDAEDLAQKMKEMLHLSDFTLTNFGANGRKKVEDEFSESIVIEKYMDEIRNVGVAC